MRLALILVAVLVACAPMASPAAHDLGSTHIGPLRFGMSASDIGALGLPTTRDQVFSEGGAYDRTIVTIRDGETIEAVFFDNRLSDIETRSPSFSTDRGARVGATLAELQALYPEGRVNIGNEEGGYFNFMTPDHGFFDLDQEGVPDSCFEYRGECPDLGAQHSIGYRIRDLSNVGVQ